MDGGSVTAPRWAFYGLRGEWEVENHGITPDIEVDQDPKLVREGHDPPLERAVAVALLPNQLHSWKRQFEEKPNSAFSGEVRRRGEETQVAELERKIGQQATEIGFLKGCLRQIEDLRRSQAQNINPPSAGKSGKNGKGAAG